MTQAKCFSCGHPLRIGRSMEDLLDVRFPVFCSNQCSAEFPDNGTPEFEKALSELKKQPKGVDG